MYVVSSLAVLVSLGGTLAMAFPLLGGWNEIAVDDVKVVELANWAVGQIGNGYSLLNIQGAEYQIVAGRNYRLELNLNTGNNLRSTCTVTIYEDFEGTKTMNEPTLVHVFRPLW